MHGYLSHSIVSVWFHRKWWFHRNGLISYLRIARSVFLPAKWKIFSRDRYYWPITYIGNTISSLMYESNDYFTEAITVTVVNIWGASLINFQILSRNVVGFRCTFCTMYLGISAGWHAQTLPHSNLPLRYRAKYFSRVKSFRTGHWHTNRQRS